MPAEKSKFGVSLATVASLVSSLARLQHKVVREPLRHVAIALPRTQWLSAFSALFVFLNPGEGRAQHQPFDGQIYHLAVDYCRGTVPRPMALSSDRRILCFDGWVDDGMDLSPVRDLGEDGLFVVRSFGGHAATAIALSYLLRDRHATIVVYDYCVSACASYFFVASDQT
jgi:hypothetical protein